MQIALFYLVLRGLDTVEDDMTLSIERKAPLLEEFHLKLEEDGWNFTECKSLREVTRPLNITDIDNDDSWTGREGQRVADWIPPRDCRIQAAQARVS